MDDTDGKAVYGSITLGQQQPYVDEYDPALLQPIPRRLSRDNLVLPAFYGVDVWTGYELSWLSPGGKPCVAIAEFTIPSDSPNIIESKSFKYYLNSFNQTVCVDKEAFCDLLQRDLSRVAGANVGVQLFELSEFEPRPRGAGGLGRCLDTLDVALQPEAPISSLLQPVAQTFNGVWYSHLLKSNCPVTGQPDWASLWVGWQGGMALRPESLLRYIVAYRRHQDFHENCVERIFADLYSVCQPQELWVYARYTRRGGLDINPFRSLRQREIPAVFGVRQ